jgi:hypothetical protein
MAAELHRREHQMQISLDSVTQIDFGLSGGWPMPFP